MSSCTITLPNTVTVEALSESLSTLLKVGIVVEGPYPVSDRNGYVSFTISTTDPYNTDTSILRNVSYELAKALDIPLLAVNQGSDETTISAPINAAVYTETIYDASIYENDCKIINETTYTDCIVEDIYNDGTAAHNLYKGAGTDNSYYKKAVHTTETYHGKFKIVQRNSPLKASEQSKKIGIYDNLFFNALNTTTKNLRNIGTIMSSSGVDKATRQTYMQVESPDTEISNIRNSGIVVKQYNQKYVGVNEDSYTRAKKNGDEQDDNGNSTSVTVAQKIVKQLECQDYTKKHTITESDRGRVDLLSAGRISRRTEYEHKPTIKNYGCYHYATIGGNHTGHNSDYFWLSDKVGLAIEWFGCIYNRFALGIDTTIKFSVDLDVVTGNNAKCGISTTTIIGGLDANSIDEGLSVAGFYPSVGGVDVVSPNPACKPPAFDGFDWLAGVVEMVVSMAFSELVWGSILAGIERNQAIEKKAQKATKALASLLGRPLTDDEKENIKIKKVLQHRDGYTVFVQTGGDAEIANYTEEMIGEGKYITEGDPVEGGLKYEEDKHKKFNSITKKDESGLATAWGDPVFIYQVVAPPSVVEELHKKTPLSDSAEGIAFQNAMNDLIGATEQSVWSVFGMSWGEADKSARDFNLQGKSKGVWDSASSGSSSSS
jgi:hypothetical protein